MVTISLGQSATVHMTITSWSDFDSYMQLKHMVGFTLSVTVFGFVCYTFNYVHVTSTTHKYLSLIGMITTDVLF